MYIVIEIQTNSDGTVGNLVWAFDNEAQAQQKYHYVLASAAVSGLPCHSCVILRNDGEQIALTCYKDEDEE